MREVWIMKYKDKKVQDVQIAYIGGGSRGWAWTFMTDLALEPDMSGTIRLYDIDREAAEANEVIGNAVSAREDAKGKWEYRTCATLGEALTGADFAVISILPGTFDEMEADVHLPERLGIWQSVGDTAGPGGMMRALRTIPMFVEIAEAVKEYAPGAWVINYTNPMSLCVKTLYHTFPDRMLPRSIRHTEGAERHPGRGVRASGHQERRYPCECAGHQSFHMV